MLARLLRVSPYLRLMRIEKPIGASLLIAPCLWSAAVVPSPSFGAMAAFVAGGVVMRGAGCTINDLWDRNIDKMVSLRDQ